MAEIEWLDRWSITLDIEMIQGRTKCPKMASFLSQAVFVAMPYNLVSLGRWWGK
jgi:hypothetical protein